MKTIDKYLDKLNKSDESIFPMDNVHTGKPLKIYKKGRENKKSGREILRNDIDSEKEISEYHA